MENTSLFYWILKSMKNFNDMELKGVISGQLKPTDEENCYLLVYWRAVNNVDTVCSDAVQQSTCFVLQVVVHRFVVRVFDHSIRPKQRLWLSVSRDKTIYKGFNRVRIGIRLLLLLHKL
jgi:hypothetical protein